MSDIDLPTEVPPPPYFHGTRADLAPGDELKVGLVDPAAGDDRLMTWACTTVEWALKWAFARNRMNNDTLFVYEVELDHPEPDVNHAAGPGHPVASVMAPSGRVVRLVKTVTRH